MAQKFDHGYAIVVGVDQNRIERLALPTVARDVRAIYEVLIHPERCAYDPDNVKLLKGEEATSKNILDTLYWLQEQVADDPEATAVVYYSGHGMFDRAGKQYYLIPYDIRSLNRIRADAIKAETFTAEVAAIRPERLLVLLDCCHAAGMEAKAVDLAAEAPHLEAVSFPMELPETKDIPAFDAGAKNVHQLADGQGRAILNSSTGAESSYIRRDGRMSIFTYHLIEALTGHAPHDADDATVLVTDVMSYVTREVAETARAEGRQQTPVMRTSGVFPVAMLLGGDGTKGIEAPPDPLEPLPQVPGMGVTFNQAGQTVGGNQVNIGRMEGDIGQIGDTVDTGGGAYIGGNVNTGGGDFTGRDRINRGDEVHGDQISGDINVQGGVHGRGAAIGHQATVDYEEGMSGADLDRLFAPLMAVAREAPPGRREEAVAMVEGLKAETARGEDADDSRMALLIDSFVEMAPGAVGAVTSTFATPLLAGLAGPVTRFVLDKLRKN